MSAYASNDPRLHLLTQPTCTDRTAEPKVTHILGEFAGTLSATLDGLNDLPPAPEPAGDQTKQRLLDIFTPIEQQVTDAKAKLDVAGPDDPQVLLDTSQTMSSIGTSLTQLDNPMAGIDDSPELAAAAEQAPNCQALSSLRQVTASVGGQDADVPTCTVWAVSRNTSSRPPT